jgi:polyisoprenoid-binding protein YceI
VSDADVPTDAATAGGSGRSPRRIALWVALGVVGLVALVYGAIFVYANVINDSPDALDEDDLSAALVGTTIPTTKATTADGEAVTATTETSGSADTTARTDGFDGDWVPTSASEFGYRVDEVIAGVNVTAVGRSNEIEGSMTIEGTSVTAVDVEVRVENITSDDSRRDGQFRGRIMSADEFPTATFVLTEPIELGEIPDEGEQITATATGELTLRGVTNPVSFEVTAEATADRIGVLSTDGIEVVFADYGIDNPSFGAIEVEDEGRVEFVLVFEQA